MLHRPWELASAISLGVFLSSSLKQSKGGMAPVRPGSGYWSKARAKAWPWVEAFQETVAC